MATSPDPPNVELPPSPTFSPQKLHVDKRPGMLFSSTSDGDELSCYSSYGSASSKAGNGSGDAEISKKWREEGEGEPESEQQADAKKLEEEEGTALISVERRSSNVDPEDIQAGRFSSVSLMSPSTPPDEEDEQTPTTSTFPAFIPPNNGPSFRRPSALNTSSTAHPSSSNSSSNRDSFLLSNIQKVHHSPSTSNFFFPQSTIVDPEVSPSSSPVDSPKRSSFEVAASLISEKASKRNSTVTPHKQGDPSPFNGISHSWSFPSSPLVGELKKKGTGEGRAEDEDELVEESLADEASLDDGDVDWDFWGAVVSDYEAVAQAQPHELSQAIQQGIPAVIRGSMWQLMSSSKDGELEALYSSLLHQTSSHEKSIQKDLARTFPSHKFFQRPNGPPSGSSKHEDTPQDRGQGQDDLFNVVRAYSLYDPVVGYVQGSAFIVAALLLNMPDEEAFCVFVRLMHAYGLRTCFLPEMPGLQLRLFQFDRLIEEFLPLLHIHLVRSGVKSSMYSSQWFLTLFSYRFPLALVYRVFDIIFAEGIEAVFRFALALLIKNEEQLLALEFEGILKYLSSELFDCYKEPPKEDTPTGEDASEEVWLADAFVKDAFAVQITPFQLDGFSAEWDELCRVENAHADEVSSLRAANRHLSAQVKQLESSMSLLNAEHCEVVNELVKSKIANEEMESELIKFKLLYAELSHTSDSSKQRSSQSSFWSSLGRSSSSGGASSDGK
ncbi:rab-GTPase-TBC domain-containing protein [Mrakia frigida]|uniref:TBC domain-containing protein n=1 Tax=Mrakia frigida TaxID=29902 RepID=UPI003FCC12F0